MLEKLRQTLRYLMNPGLAAQERQERADAETDAYLAAVDKARSEIAAAGFVPWIDPRGPSLDTSPYRHAEVIATRLNGSSWDRKCEVWSVATLPPWLHIGNVYWKPVGPSDGIIDVEWEEVRAPLLLH